MKYTKEYVFSHKIAIECATTEQKIEALALLLAAGGKFSGRSHIERADNALDISQG